MRSNRVRGIGRGFGLPDPLLFRARPGRMTCSKTAVVPLPKFVIHRNLERLSDKRDPRQRLPQNQVPGWLRTIRLRSNGTVRLLSNTRNAQCHHTPGCSRRTPLRRPQFRVEPKLKSALLANLQGRTTLPLGTSGIFLLPSPEDQYGISGHLTNSSKNEYN